NLIDDCPVILMSPQGKVLNQKMAKKVSKYKDIIVIAGRYEGVDERIVNNLVSDEISIGDYILTGGELPAAIFIEVVTRMIPGVVGNIESIELDSITNKMLKYPVYTKPKIFRGIEVPDILFSGNHKEISDWRQKNSYENTKKKRPDLI
ncbi:MAG: tRNA (guanosine(37)-N1)-methyltransferase TrmD, partial [SAR202 cluster bacterium]|nr:tRNA (guanosine(37)-N1)-methyltransferase TrmD [SAR202 cluster bacterium]